MENGKKSLLFNTKLSSFEKLNENFMKAKCYVLALGKNVNKSHFSKENVDRAYPSLSFVPVVGHLMEDENGKHYLGGHDVSFDLSTMSIKNLCVPFGVAIPSETPQYEDITEEDGSVSTYLTSDVVLWTGRYPELAETIYNNETYFSQSMEILFSKYEQLKEDSSYIDIIDFSFDALCLLNKSDDEKLNVEPCFPSACIKPITYSIDRCEFSSLMNEMKEQLSFCMNNKDEKQGGKTLEYNKDNKIETFSTTYNQKRKAICNELNPIIVTDGNGNCIEETYFYLSDFNDEYAFIEVDHWDKDGNYSCKRGRKKYSFDEGTNTATLSNEFEEMYNVWITLDEKAKLDEDNANYLAMAREFSEYKEDYSHKNSEFDELVEYKKSAENEKRNSKEIEIFEKYEASIGNTDEFLTLKVDAKKYELDTLEKECLFIVGKYAFSTKSNDNNETNQNDSLKFSIEYNKDKKDEDPYGGLREKYLK